MPYQADPVTRAKINAGEMDYLDVHLSHVAQMVWQGFFGHLDVALIEVAGIAADGELIPSSSVGNNKTWIDQADRVILEVNSWQACAASAPSSPAHHRQLRAPGLPAGPAGLLRQSGGWRPRQAHTHLVDEAYSWHTRFLRRGTTQVGRRNAGL